MASGGPKDDAVLSDPAGNGSGAGIRIPIGDVLQVTIRVHNHPARGRDYIASNPSTTGLARLHATVTMPTKSIRAVVRTMSKRSLPATSQATNLCSPRPVL
jgi:hypothetical protein